MLDGNSPTPQTSFVWTGASSFNSSDPATINTTGNYYLTTTRSDNGCTKIDSVFAGYKPDLILSSNNDTLVCKNSSINLSASVLGSVSGVNYSWSSGSTSASTIVNPAITTTYIVSANSPGCSGTDTVVVAIPPDITDSIAAFQTCNGTTTGVVQVYAYGGIPPYLYSINNGTTFSTIGNFNNTPYGNYNVVIKDSLGCTKTNTAVLNGFSNLPVAQFIASTQNTQGDTIVLVDISSPQPDSVSWILPAQASIIGGDMFNPVVFMPDTGGFVVTMIGYFGNCVIDTTKLIHFFIVDTTFASAENNNGIKTLTLYPNPNNGTFTVGVEFYKKQNSSIQLWDAHSVKYLQQNFMDTDLRWVETFQNLSLCLPSLMDSQCLIKVLKNFLHQINSFSLVFCSGVVSFFYGLNYTAIIHSII